MQKQTYMHHTLRQDGWQLLKEKLDPRYLYHSLNHTREVCHRAIEIAQQLGCEPEEVEQLHTAAVYHDVGFTVSHENHEQRGAAIFREKALKLDMPEEEIALIESLIMVTKPFNEAQNELECIIKDADLYYISTNDYARQANLLRKELEWLNIPMDDAQWKSFQVKFLREHRFLSPGIEISLNARKAKVLERLDLL